MKIKKFPSLTSFNTSSKILEKIVEENQIYCFGNTNEFQLCKPYGEQYYIGIAVSQTSKYDPIVLIPSNNPSIIPLKEKVFQTAIDFSIFNDLVEFISLKQQQLEILPDLGELLFFEYNHLPRMELCMPKEIRNNELIGGYAQITSLKYGNIIPPNEINILKNLTNMVQNITYDDCVLLKGENAKSYIQKHKLLQKITHILREESRLFNLPYLEIQSEK
jgi:hypothetical protein